MDLVQRFLSEVEFFSPKEGDPADYVAIKFDNGERVTITNSCAANVLGFDDNVIVEVYEAVLNNGTWEKGEKVTFTNEDNPKITSDVVAGTQSLAGRLS